MSGGVMGKQSRGEWVAETYDGGAFEIRCPYMVIATRNGYEEWAFAEESAANAKLMAAAPDLLRSLADTLSLAVLKWGNLDPDANKVFESARAAIAKAKGKP